MKKTMRWLALLCALTCVGSAMVACEEENPEVSSPESSISAPDSGSTSENGSSNLGGESEERTIPTAQEIVFARKKVVDETTEKYDFSMNFTGNFSVLGHTAALGANYNGQYRYDETTGDLQFKRTTGGALLNDATEYICTQGSQRVKVNLEDDGSVKKVASILEDEEELNMVNKPFVALVDSLQITEITNITELTSGEYDYKASLQLSANNTYVNKICGLIGGLGTSISIKGVEFTNPISGFELYFNLDNERLDTFQLEAQLSVPVKSVDVTLDLEYAQQGNTAPVTIPTVNGIAITKSDITNELNTVTNALTALKAQDDYSLDMLAKNEFDPGWNVTATVDQYQARLYKNTVGSNVWFNHSYIYKAHHETDGAEAYKYTIGNLNDGQNSVYLVSRRGTNTSQALQNVSVDTQFDYLTSMIQLNSNNVDCINKKTKDGGTVYYIHLNKTATISVQDTILDLINSNEGEGVIDVNNYFNSSSYTVKEAQIVVEMANSQIKNIECKTELQYEPTGGEYTEYNIVLTNTIKLEVNKNLDKASEYVAPEKLSETILGIIKGGLMFASYYIM